METDLNVHVVQSQSFGGISECVAVAFSLEVGKAPIAIVHSHSGVSLNSTGIILDSLVEVVFCKQVQNQTSTKHHEAIVLDNRITNRYHKFKIAVHPAL